MTTHPTPAVQPSSELLLMLLADARLPSGGHTQSGGLEPALRAGLTIADVPGYLTARLRTVVPSAAGAAVVVGRAMSDEPDRSASVIASAWREWTARTPSDAIRVMEERLGRGYRRLVERLWGTAAAAPLDAAASLLEEADGGRPLPPRPLVVGLLADIAGLKPEQTARLVGYDDVQTVVSACLKLEPIDPMTATAWTMAAFGEVDAMARRVGGISDPRDIPASGAPLIDLWAQTHAATRERLFSA